MTDPLPLSHVVNLARLGQAGDTASFAADADQLTAIAHWSGILSLQSLAVTVAMQKLAPTRFGLNFQVTAALEQACVVTLEPVPAAIERRFSRELHFSGPPRRKPAPVESALEVVLDAAEDEAPEEIASLHYDLAGPVLEEFVLALEPYPRRPGVAFDPQTNASDRPESPFAVLKGLK